MSQGFAVLREMNYKYFQPGHWKCFPLQSSSPERSVEEGKQELVGTGHLLRVSSSAQC